MSESPAAPALKPQFASDNTAGICPEAWEAMARANADFASSYGTDTWTERAADMLRERFETGDAEVFFVFNGTAANSLALASCCQSYHSVISHEHAHIVVDECGAPEFFSNGTKLLGAPGEHGKIAPESIARIASKRTDIHYPKPRVVSLTQSTEFGTVYEVPELEAIHETAARNSLVMHVDGARFANAAASLRVAPKALTWQAGVDVLCLGGTKLGMANCEAVIFFNRELAREFDYRCKRIGAPRFWPRASRSRPAWPRLIRCRQTRRSSCCRNSSPRDCGSADGWSMILWAVARRASCVPGKRWRPISMP
jgi:threonine aldolase